MKETLKSSFNQLLVIYTVIILIISLGFLSKYTLQFQILGLIISVLGIFSIRQNREFRINKRLHYILFGLAILIILTTRTIPYVNNDIPLGYDPGIYKYAIEKGLQTDEKWIISQITMEPLFLYIMQPIKLLFSSQFILTYLLIFFTVILGVAIYLTTKSYFNKETALISLFIYAISLIQFKAFWYNYYRNILGLILLMFALYFHKNNKRIPFIILAGLLGAMHRPTFYIFGLTYLIFTIIHYKNLKTNIINGVSILAISLIFYIGKFWPAISQLINPVVQGYLQPGEASGTFIDFFTYQYSILPYLPLALLGLFYLVKKKEFNIIVVWATINLAIVYFQFFFFNRLIIMLEIPLIILSAYGFNLLIENNKKLGAIITIILILSGTILIFKDSINSKPLISNNELEVIKQLQNTPEDSWVMTTSSLYSPWVLGYSERKTIAPGLFDYDKHNEQEWNNFWRTTNLEEIKDFLDAYNKPLYIFIGQKQPNNLEQFEECFKLYYENEKNKIYEYTC